MPCCHPPDRPSMPSKSRLRINGKLPEGQYLLEFGLREDSVHSIELLLQHHYFIGFILSHHIMYMYIYSTILLIIVGDSLKFNVKFAVLIKLLVIIIKIVLLKISII